MITRDPALKNTNANIKATRRWTRKEPIQINNDQTREIDNDLKVLDIAFTNESELRFNELLNKVLKELQELREQVTPVSKFFNSLNNTKSKTTVFTDTTSEDNIRCGLKAKVMNRMRRKGVI